MARDPALVPLSHDHHHALAAARRLRLAAGEPAPGRAAASRTFLDFYQRSLLPHFREEEELVFPLLVEAAPTVPDILARVLVDHVQIHGLLLRLRRALDEGGDLAGDMQEIAKRLESHIRLEERELFPLIEEVVPAPALAELTLPPQRRDPSRP
ncbi:MAG TPA: hemerythrin domain-containing protein [Actinomycetota bacterium]|nr:hemerythrin domain-containing protein [Actinomycetota bacterium]